MSSLTPLTDVRLWNLLSGVAIILLAPITLGWAYFRRRRTMFTGAQWMSLALLTAILIFARLALFSTSWISGTNRSMPCQTALRNMLIALYCGATLAALVMLLYRHVSRYVPAMLLLWVVMDVILMHKSGVQEQRLLVEWNQLVNRLAPSANGDYNHIPTWKTSKRSSNALHTDPLGIIFWQVNSPREENKEKVKQSCIALLRLQKLYNDSPVVRKHVEDDASFGRSLFLYTRDVRHVAALIHSTKNPKLPLPGCITTLSFLNCFFSNASGEHSETLQDCVDTLIHTNMTTVQFGVDPSSLEHLDQVDDKYLPPAKFIGAILQFCGRDNYSFTTVDMSAIDNDAGKYNQNFVSNSFEGMSTFFDWSSVLLHVLHMSNVKTLQLCGIASRTNVNNNAVEKFVDAFITASATYKEQKPTSTNTVQCDLRENAGLLSWKALFESASKRKDFCWTFRFDN